MKAKIQSFLKKSLPDAKLLSYRLATKGHVNISYFLRIQVMGQKEEWVLRLYPKDGWKATKEKYLYDLIRKKTQVPVPEVLLLDTSKKIFQQDFLLLKRVPGKELKRNQSALIKEAGRILAKIHSIKFSKFGWIIGKEIKPPFKRWKDFVLFDIHNKLEKLPIKLKKDINTFIKEKKDLLDLKTIPCLLHKDYSFAHIIADKKINGIIDFEWGQSGHNEYDVAKSLLWMFPNDKNGERQFLRGYTSLGSLSKDFEQRRVLYELLVNASALSFAKKLGSKKWYNYNLKTTKKVLYG